MKKGLLNLALVLTAGITLIVLIVFFVKLNNVSVSSNTEKDSAKQDSGDYSEDISKAPLSSLTGKQAENKDIKNDKDDEVQIVEPVDDGEKVTENPTPSAEPETVTPEEPPEDEKPSETQTEDAKLYTTYPVDISKIDPEKPIVALSFDDGPSSNTDTILETLAEYGAHATFFMVGENIDMYPERVKKVYESGCEVANHTINHKDLIKLSKEDIRKEVDGNQDKLNEVLGTNIDFLVRPPYGDTNETVKSTIAHPLIIWWVDTLDWQSKNADSVFAEVKKSTKDGSIILMHDLYKSTADAVKKVVPWLKEQGYQICSVSEMFAARGVKLENGKNYNSVIDAAKYKENKEGSKSGEE